MRDKPERLSIENFLPVIFLIVITNGHEINGNYLFDRCPEFLIFVWPKKHKISITKPIRASMKRHIFTWGKFTICWDTRLSIESVYSSLLETGITLSTVQIDLVPNETL